MFAQRSKKQQQSNKPVSAKASTPSEFIDKKDTVEAPLFFRCFNGAVTPGALNNNTKPLNEIIHKASENGQSLPCDIQSQLEHQSGTFKFCPKRS